MRYFAAIGVVALAAMMVAACKREGGSERARGTGSSAVTSTLRGGDLIFQEVKAALQKRFAGATFDPAETVVTPTPSSTMSS